MILGDRGMKIGPPHRVELHIPAIVPGQKELMIAAAEKILFLQVEVTIRLSTLKKVTYYRWDQFCAETFLRYMPWGHQRKKLLSMVTAEKDKETGQSLPTQ